MQYVTRLPVKLKISDDLTEKYLLRIAARAFVNDADCRRRKRPFIAPPGAGSPESALFRLAQDTFRSRCVANRGFYDQTRVIGLLDKIPSMDREDRDAIDLTLKLILSVSLLQQELWISA